MPRGIVARAVLAFVAMALALGLASMAPGQRAFAQGSDGVQDSQDAGMPAGEWSVQNDERSYSADEEESFLRACFRTADVSSVESLLDGDCRFEVDFGNGEGSVSYSGSEIKKAVSKTETSATVCFDLVFDLTSPQRLSAEFYYSDELVCQWNEFWIISPLTLDKDLFVVDQAAMAVTFANPVGADGDYTVSALVPDDVSYYWVVNDARIDDAGSHDPSVPGTHELWVKAASGNVVDPAEGGLCLGVWTVPAPSEGVVPEEGPVDSGQDEGDVSDQEQGQGSAPSADPDFPATPTVPPAPVTPPAESPDETFQFKDVPEGAWFEEAVYGVAEDGVMLPHSETVFGVRDALSRGEAAQLAMRLLGGVPEGADAADGDAAGEAGESEAGLARTFSDVDEACPYAEAIEWVSARGIMNGYAGTDIFGAQDAITQEQLAVVLFNVRTWQGEVAPGTLSEECVSEVLSHTQGAHRVSNWAKEAVAWALLGAWKERLAVDPQCPVTRGQAASVIYGARP